MTQGCTAIEGSSKNRLRRGRAPESKQETRDQAGGVFVLIRLQNRDMLLFEQKIIYNTAY